MAKIDENACDRAVTDFCRRVAGLMLTAQAERSMDTADITEQSGVDADKVFDSLLDGRGVGLRDLARVFAALDFRIKFDLVHETPSQDRVPERSPELPTELESDETPATEAL